MQAEVSERSSSTRCKDALGLTELKLVPTAGDEFEAERAQWDDGNNVVALEPGVVVAYERNEATNAKLTRPASRCSPSPARSSAAVAAAATA